MPTAQNDQLDQTFFALSDPTRRAMLSRLAEGHTAVADLRRPFAISAPAVSKHLRVLERAGLVRQVREGRVRQCHLVAEPLKEAAAWVERYRQFWEAKLDRLEEYLGEVQSNDASNRKRNKEL